MFFHQIKSMPRTLRHIHVQLLRTIKNIVLLLLQLLSFEAIEIILFLRADAVFPAIHQKRPTRGGVFPELGRSELK